ncbi:hypothetical protein MW290_19645 [Aquincola tertiaricarbonis]|uniref:GFO/IDH/MocA-like oxidoreductase domain-containing protein n=1 Tax=Aquincola tertiaricarbonis TaxID=391953 RepID=A0ABY4SGA4_AQUTE|nr:hypothetical protein [Aquincola tertiaricarbonis]URI11175.1 hypothetical protein MW290_19645 [Aquincola tertiaricarbonis]
MTTSQPVRWGILSTAGIGLRRAIPVLQQNPALMEVRAIASRQHAAAEAAAQAHGIAVAHGSYEALRAGEIGTLRFMQVPFGYFNTDAANIRNRPEAGGGALYDIGCYAVAAARWCFEREPVRVACSIDRDADFGTDRLCSALLDFGAAG